MTIKELREKRKKAWDTARDFLDSKRNADGVLSEEDSRPTMRWSRPLLTLAKKFSVWNDRLKSKQK